MPSALKDGGNLKTSAATCEALIKGSRRVPMAKQFANVGMLLLQSPDRIESAVSVR